MPEPWLVKIKKNGRFFYFLLPTQYQHSLYATDTRMLFILSLHTMHLIKTMMYVLNFECMAKQKRVEHNGATPLTYFIQMCTSKPIILHLRIAHNT